MRMHRRAVEGTRRLLALAEAPDPDVVGDALLSELTTALTLDSVTAVPSGQAEPRIIDVRRTPGRMVTLEYSPRGGYETVELAAYQQPRLDRDERSRPRSCRLQRSSLGFSVRSGMPRPTSSPDV